MQWTEFAQEKTFALNEKLLSGNVASIFYYSPIYHRNKLLKIDQLVQKFHERGPLTTLQIYTVFNCVPLSTVISLYGLYLIA